MAAKRRKKRKKRHSSPLRGFFRGLYRFTVALSALIVVLWGAWQLASRKPTVAERPIDATITDDPSTDDVDESQGLQRKEGTWTFLLCAEDQVSGSADTIMVCTYDTVNQKVGLVSVPRDTLVVREGWKYNKLNAAYSNGNSYFPPDGGRKELMDAVSEVLGIPIDHYGGRGL